MLKSFQEECGCARKSGVMQKYRSLGKILCAAADKQSCYSKTAMSSHEHVLL